MATTPAKKKKKKKKDKSTRILNDRPRMIFRKIISNGERTFGIVFLVIVVLMGGWFIVQKNNFDPGERDISMQVMIDSAVEDHLWEPPLEIWVEPGTAVAGAAAGPDVGIYPASIVSNGWSTLRSVKTFDFDTLYEKVDGQEAQYKDFGFKFMHFLDIAKTGTELECKVELYDQGEFQNALGVFSEQRNVDSKVESVGDAWLTRTSNGALAIYNNYFFKFSGTEDNEAFSEHAAQVVRDFSESNDGTGKVPKPFVILARGLNVAFQDIGYRKEDVFQYDFAQDFWFGGTGDGSDAKYFIHDAGSPEAAAALYEQLVEEFGFDYEELERTDTDALYTHDVLKTFNTVNHAGSYVFGVDGMPDKDTLTTKLSELRKVLEAS
jgi:hypothetical protein